MAYAVVQNKCLFMGSQRSCFDSQAGRGVNGRVRGMLYLERGGGLSPGDTIPSSPEGAWERPSASTRARSTSTAQPPFLLSHGIPGGMSQCAHWMIRAFWLQIIPDTQIAQMGGFFYHIGTRVLSFPTALLCGRKRCCQRLGNHLAQYFQARRPVKFFY